MTKLLSVMVIKMKVNLPHRRRQISVLIKLRAKMVTIIYKTDILLVFFFVMVFGMFFHYLTWIYEPPDLMNTEINYSEQQRLIREWKMKKMQEEAEAKIRGGVSNGDIDSHIDDFAPGFDNGAVLGPNSRRRERILGEALNFEENVNGLSHEAIHKRPLSDFLLGRRHSQAPYHIQGASNQNKQERKQIYDSIKLKLQGDKIVQNSKDELLHDISQSVIRKRVGDSLGDTVPMSNDTLSNKLRNKKKYKYLKLTTPRPDEELHKVFAELQIKDNNKTNQTAMDKLIANIDKESEHVDEMKPSDRAQWLDDQAEELYKLMFHKYPKPIKSEVLQLNIAAPIGGKLKGGPAQCSLYDTGANINDTFECMPMYLTGKPKVTVCLYPSNIDVHISKHIREDGIWEPHIVKEFQNILFSNPDYGVIDIGANIGVYSLIAATMGHSVVSVEPYITNIKHFHKAIQLGKFADKITLLRNAIYEKRLNYMSLKLNKDNQGGIAVDPGRNDPCLATTCTNTVKAIYMDDLLEVINFRNAVMKIDIEGFEHRAFVHSSKLFDQVFVSHIIMEWILLRDYYGTELDHSEDKTLVQKLVDTLFDRGYRPYSLVTAIELKRRYWYAWPDDIIWKNDLEEFN